MALTLDNMMIGIGFMIDKASEKMAKAQIDGIAQKATQLGKKVGGAVAGAFGINEISHEWVGSMKQLAVISDRFNVAAADIQAYDKVIQKAGGSQGDFNNILSRMNSMQNLSAADKAGMVAGVADKGIAGAIQSVMGAGSEIEGFLRAADAMQNMSAGQQERFAETMGFSNAEIVLLKKGRQEIEKQVVAQKQLSTITPEMTKAATEFDAAWKDLTSSLGGIFDHIAMGVNIQLTKMIKIFSKLIETIAPMLNGAIDFAFSKFGEVILGVAAAVAIFGKAWVMAKIGSFLKLLGGFGKGASSIVKIGGAFVGLGKILSKFIPVLAAISTAFALFDSATSKDGMINSAFKGVSNFLGFNNSPEQDKKSVAKSSSSQQTVHVNSKVQVETNDNVFKAKLTEHSTHENEKAIDSLDNGVLA